MKKFKKLSIVAIILAMFFSVCVFAARDIKITLNGQNVETDAAPFIENGRTLVPIRVISESLGYDVDWDEVTRSVSVKNDDKVVELVIDSKTVFIDNKVEEIDVAPIIQSETNRTFVPIRFIAEAFGVDVGWDDETSTVFLNYDSGFRADLSRREEQYLLEAKELIDTLNGNMKDMRSYFSEGESQYEDNELREKADKIRINFEESFREIKSMNVPDKFKNSHELFVSAFEKAKGVLNLYENAILDENRQKAFGAINLELEYSIDIESAQDALKAELKGEKYIPDKDIDVYNRENAKNIQNLLEKIQNI